MSWFYQPIPAAVLLTGLTPAEGVVGQDLGFSQTIIGFGECLGVVNQDLGFSQVVTCATFIEAEVSQDLGFSQTIIGFGECLGTLSQDLGFSQTFTGSIAIAGVASQTLSFSQTLTGFTGGLSGSVSQDLGFSQVVVGVCPALVTIPDSITTTSSFFDTKFAEAIYKGFKGRLLKGYYRQANISGLDALGDRAVTYNVYTCEGIVSTYSAFYKKTYGIPDSDDEILIIANSLSITPTKADQVKFRSQWYQVREISKDPANATWSLQAFKIADPTI